MTVNTLFKENELGELYEYLLPYYKAGLDGVIVQDLGAVLYSGAFSGNRTSRQHQMTITSVYGAKELKRLGCCRVVPAREVSLEEIRRIYDETGMDIETFVHGALCYCYSGQCLLSSLIGGRSGNRGRCAQPCRLPYDVLTVGGTPLKGAIHQMAEGKRQRKHGITRKKMTKSQEIIAMFEFKGSCTLDISSGCD